VNYEDLLNEADGYKLKVKEINLTGNKGRIKGNRIAIKKDLATYKEKACILAEELGHYKTSYGNILDMNNSGNRKQEYKARLWAYDKQVGLIGIITAFNNGCLCLFDMAEFLNVTEEFLADAINCYQQKYGEYIIYENYIIYFIPTLGVMKMI